MTPCSVCGKPCVKADDEPEITSRMTTAGMDFVHVACVPQLPAADGPFGYRYPAGSIEGVPS